MTTNDNDKKGFGGFDSLVSDVTKEVEIPFHRQEPKSSNSDNQAEASKQQSNPPPIHTQKSNQTQIPQDKPKKKSGSGVAWVLGIGFILIIFALLGGKKEVIPPTEAPAAVLEAPAVEVEAPVSEAPAVEARDPQNPEEQPPIGSGIAFNNNQIRYCLSMDVRLGAIKEALNSYSKDEIDSFNSIIHDYNSRCSNFRYRIGALESVQGEVKLNHSTLVIEGLKMLESWRPENNATIKSSQAPSNLPDPYDSVVAANQSNSKVGELPSSSERNKSSELSSSESNSIESACGYDKRVNGPAAYNKCVSNKIDALKNAPEPDISKLSSSESNSIESVCGYDKRVNGPAAYNKCVSNKIDALKNAPEPDISKLSSSESNSIESVCGYDKRVNGPAAYNKCVSNKIDALKNAPEPDISKLSSSEANSIESVCGYDKRVNGPAAYNKCVSNKIDALKNAPEPDTSKLSSLEANSIESACGYDKRVNGPAAYNKCVASQMSALH